MSSGRQNASGLALGSVLSGLLAHVAFALVTRGPGAEAASPVAVLWTCWTFTGAAFTFPVQHWVTRSTAAGREDEVRRAAARVTLVVAGSAAGLGLLAWLGREQLFRRDDAAFPALVVLVALGSALVGAVRGGLGGRERFGAVAVTLVAENGLRCVLVASLLLVGVRDPVAHGLCLVAGSAVVLAWPSALRLRGSGPTPARGGRTPPGPLVFLSGAASSQLVGQAVLTGGPVVLALLGGSPAQVTSVFAAFALFRAPYQVALGAVPQLTVRVARDGVSRSWSASAVARPALAGSLLVGLAGVLAGWLGPAVLRVVFGPTVDVGRGTAALLAVGCTVAVANLVLTVVALGQDRPLAAAAAWVVAVTAGAAALLVLDGLDPVGRTSVAFVAAEAAAFGGLALAVARRP